MPPSMFMPMYLSFSNVPHAQMDIGFFVHFNELGPFRLGSTRNLDNTLTRLLFPMNPRDFTLGQIDVGNGTIRSQVGIVDSGDYAVLAEISR